MRVQSASSEGRNCGILKRQFVAVVAHERNGLVVYLINLAPEHPYRSSGDRTTTFETQRSTDLNHMHSSGCKFPL